MNNTAQPNDSQVPAQGYKRRARNLIIHKPMQREFTLVTISLLMLSTLVIGFIIHQTLREAALGGGFHFGKINPYEILNEVRYTLLVRTFLVLFVTIAVLAAFGIFFLHRIAGPVYRMHRIFAQINDGKVAKITTPIRLREGDFFAETVMEIDQIVEKIKAVDQKLDGLLVSPGNEAFRHTLQEMKGLLSEIPGK